MKLVTHDDRFHADDVFTMATFRILLGDQITQVVRTRDEAIIKSADIVFDVGNVYDPETNRFDHHQKEGAGTLDNGVPYASFGIVWKKYGAQICRSQEAADIVDAKLVQPIDAGDNGYTFYEYTKDDVFEYGLNTMIASFSPTWKEEENFDETFFVVTDMAQRILSREITLAQHKIEAIPIVTAAYEHAEDKRIVVLDQSLPWRSALEQYEEVLYVVSPKRNMTQWNVNALQPEPFVSRKNLPAEWAGLSGAELEKVTGVPGAIFCHRGRFIAVAQTKEAALLLAKKAVEA